MPKYCKTCNLQDYYKKKNAMLSTQNCILEKKKRNQKEGGGERQ